MVLYDDSTMAWFTEPGRSSPTGKILVKEAPEMLAIAHWTGQIPRRPPLPAGVDVPVDCPRIAAQAVEGLLDAGQVGAGGERLDRCDYQDPAAAASNRAGGGQAAPDERAPSSAGAH